MAYGGEGYRRPDDLDELGLSRLHKCARTGKAWDMEVLLEGCENVDIQDQWGKTPLMAAVEAGRTDIVNLLLERGANPTHTSFRGEQPVFLACTFGHLDIVGILSEVVDIGCLRDARGSNALHYAVQGHGAASPELIRLLLAKGLSPSECDSKGWSSLRLAKQTITCHVTREVYELLKEYSIDQSGAAGSLTSPFRTRRSDSGSAAEPSSFDGPPYPSQSTESGEVEELRDRLKKKTELIRSMQRQLSDSSISTTAKEMRVLSEPNLLSLARKIGVDDRFMLAIYLGFPSETWQGLERQHQHEPIRATFEVLRDWVKLRNIDTPTRIMVKELCGALDEIRRPDLKEMLLDNSEQQE